MSDKLFQKLVKINDKEPSPDLNLSCINGDDLVKILNYIIGHFALDVSESNSFRKTIYSPSIPGPTDRNKIWVKTSSPFGVGYFIDGEYKMDYSICGYPVGAPFLTNEATVLANPVEGLALLTPSEIEKFGITDTKPSSGNVTERKVWAMFTPPAISV